MALFAKDVVASRGGLVVAQSRTAAAAGARILAAGGNAVDAAVATSLALGVCEPWMSGIGGGCAALIQPADGPAVAIDGGMVAPAALDPAAYPLTGETGPGLFAWPGVVDDRNVTGPLAAAVPGLVAGLGLAHSRFGRLPWGEVLEPAIALADAGHRGDWYTTLRITNALRDLRRQEAAAAVFLQDGLPPVVDAATGRFGLDTRPLARTYRRLAAAGADDFYRGEIARAWLSEAEAAGTWLARDDLESYAAHLAAPRRFAYRDAEIDAMDGLFAGASLAEALAIVAEQWPGGGGVDAAAYAAYATGLLSAYRTRLERSGHAAAAGDTTHFCVVDEAGTLVTWTQTLLSAFGCHVLLPESGILLNNGIMWFDPRPGTPNALAPGARPLANMCPTLVTTASGRRIALGACGGRRILPAVLQFASFAVDAGDDLAAAFARPRIDVSGAGAATVDERLGDDVRRAVAAIVPVITTSEDIYPNRFALPSALAIAPDGTRTGTSAVCHPWSGAVATGSVPANAGDP